MIWLFAAALMALAAVSAGFRRFGLVLAGVAIVVIVGLILINDRGKKAQPPVPEGQNAGPSHQRMMDHDEYVLSIQDKKDPDAARRIALTEVRFGEIAPATDVQLPSIAADTATAPFRSVQARLYNDSTRFTLTNYSYELSVQDCVRERCTTVYEQRERGVPVMVPPNQARDLKIDLKPPKADDSPPFKLFGKARIQLACMGTRAYQTPDGLQPADAASAPVAR